MTEGSVSTINGSDAYRSTGDQHFWGFTSRTLKELLETEGFDVTIFKNKDFDHMISSHYKQEPILLARCTK